MSVADHGCSAPRARCYARERLDPSIAVLAISTSAFGRTTCRPSLTVGGSHPKDARRSRLAQTHMKVPTRSARRVTPGASHRFVVATERLDGGIPVVSVSGEVDLATAPALERTLRYAADDQRVR